MLTKRDLEMIGDLVDIKLDSKLDLKLEPIKKDLGDVKKRVRKIEK